MGQHLRRGQLLLGQSRPDLALTEFQGEIAENPECAKSHAYIAVCLVEQKRPDEALPFAQRATGLDPELDYARYALAKVRWALRDFPGAIASIEEAIGINPNQPDWHALHAAYLHDTGRLTPSLESAERGLRIHALHVGCLNLRAMTLRRLGRRQEAEQSVAMALSWSPENFVGHATLGWLKWDEGDARKALEHFVESLRLKPNYEWAREGFVCVLKARYPLYRMFSAISQWMARRRLVRIGLFLGGYAAFGAWAHNGCESRDAQIAIGGCMLAMFAIALALSLTGNFYNWLLTTNRFGRRILSNAQRRSANVINVILAGIAGIVLGNVLHPVGCAALVAGAILLVVVDLLVVLLTPPGTGRRLFLCALAFFGSIVVIVGLGEWRERGGAGASSGLLAWTLSSLLFAATIYFAARLWWPVERRSGG